MGTNEIMLKKVQAGLETVPGTGVAATRVVQADVMGSYDKALATFTNKTGTYASRRRALYGRENVGFTLTDIATYEDLAWHLQMAMKGGVAGVSDANTPPAYTYDFTPSLSTDDLKSATYEHGEPSNRYESNQVMTNTFTIRGDADSDDEPGWMFEAEQIGLGWVPTAYTAALTILDTEPILMRGTKVYVDDDGDPFGTTQLLGKVISFSVTGNINRHFKAFAEDEIGYAAGKYGRGERTFDAQLVLEFDDDVEFANYRNTDPVLRKIRIEREGSLINDGGVGPDVHKRATIDINGYWQSIAFGDREGNMTVTLGLAAYFDEDDGFDMKIEVVNDLATLA